MELEEVAAGLWRWSAPHPAWQPAGEGENEWGEMVGSVYYEPPAGDCLILIDPQAPREGSEDSTRFWDALDRDVKRLGLPVVILVSNRFHARSAPAIVERYGVGPGVSILTHADAAGRLSCKETGTFREGEDLPGGVEAYLLSGLEDPEVVFHLRPHRTLVLADALLGVGGGKVRVPPESWANKTEAGIALYHREYRDSLLPLLELGAERLVVSHGESVLQGGTAALAEALEAPARGEKGA